MLADIDIYRKKLNIKARRRGIKELDLILEQFAEKNLPNLTQNELHDFDSILDEEDSKLLSWALNPDSFPKNLNINLWNLIIKYKNPYIN